MCTATLCCLDGNADHMRQRVAMAIVGLSPIERQVAFKVERGWKNLALYADVNGKFSQDYHAIMDDGIDTAATNVFVRRDGVIRHFWGAELGLSRPTRARTRPPSRTCREAARAGDRQLCLSAHASTCEPQKRRVGYRGGAYETWL